jgi:3-hydroxybutyryl-CoA dehydrogenase
MRKVGVVGCGIMGSGIAQVCAQAGYQVIASEIDKGLLDKGLKSISSSLANRVEKGKLSQEDMEAILSRIQGTVKVDDFADCDLVIEAAIENLEVKKRIFSSVDRVCPEHTLLATNTSVLSVIDMAMETGRPEKVLGLHFMNPVAAMPLVEIVRTIVTAEETIMGGREFCESLGKKYIIARDTPGFIINGLLTPFLLNAVRMLENRVATKEDIDAGIKFGLNHPMGPLTLLDLIGIDTVYFGASAQYEEFKDPQYAPPPLMRKMVTAGLLGRKTGKGFYEYQ